MEYPTLAKTTKRDTSTLAMTYNKMIRKHEIPCWFTKGKTYLLPKNGKTDKAQNYRPLTCLNNVYKTLTKIIYQKDCESVRQWIISNRAERMLSKHMDVKTNS